MNWHWPQWIYASLIALSVVINIVKQGEPKTDRYGEFDDAVAIALVIWLLYMGGFWTPAQ